MTKHILLVDDQPNILHSLDISIKEKFKNYTTTEAYDCDTALYYIERNSPKIDLLILDLEFKKSEAHKLKEGYDLLHALKKKHIEVPTIIYTSDLNLMKIHPIIKDFDPAGIVTKDTENYKDIYFAIEKVLLGGKHYTDSINRQLRRRTEIEYSLDATKKKIIKYLPSINIASDWEDTDVGLSSKSIKKRLEELYVTFDVENDKQLLLKLIRLGYIQ